MEEESVASSMHLQICANFQPLRQKNIAIDVEIIVGERRFPAHRLVLMTGSKFFKTMFTTNMKEKHQKEIPVGESVFEASIFELILDCIYTGQLDINENNAEDLVRAADFLDIEPIKSHGEKFMSNKIFAENAIEWLFFANDYNLADLHIACSDYLMANAYLVAQTERFLNMNHEDFLCVIGIFQKILQKLIIYKFIMIWIKHLPTERHGHLFELLNSLPLESLPKKFLQEFVAHEALIRETQKCSQLLSNATASSKDLEETIYIFSEGCHKWMMFDANKERWIVLPSMPLRRHDIRQGVIDSKIFICGGQFFENREHTDEMHAFDTVCQEWTNLKPMNSKRTGHGMAAHNGKLYVCGGAENSKKLYVEPLSSISSVHMERYCPVTDCWEEMAPMLVARSYFQLVELNDYLYAIAGNSNNYQYTNTVERYDPRINAWTMVAPTNSVESDLYFEAVVFKNKIFITYENMLETYNPINDYWNEYDLLDFGINAHLGGKLAIFQGKLYYFSWKYKPEYNEDKIFDEDYFYSPHLFHYNEAEVYIYEENVWSLTDHFPKTSFFTNRTVIQS